MRLTTEQVEIIKQEATRVFGPDVKVRLFGSRVDDRARGGDIDLLVASDTPIHNHRRKALRLVARLQMRLGDQPIDVLVLDPTVTWQPVHESALRSGEVL